MDITPYIYYTILAIIGIASIAGNALVVVSMVKCRELHHNRNYLLTSLAVNDLLYGILMVCLSFYCTLGSNCANLYTLTIDYYFLTCSLYGMCAVALERYIAIMRPLRYMQLVTNKRTFWTILAVWLLSAAVPIVISTVILLLGVETEDSNLYFLEILQIPIAFLLVFAIFHAIPFITTLIVYIRIWLVAIQQSNRIKTEYQMMQIHVVNQQQCQGQEREVHEPHRRATTTIGIILLCFTISWTLYTSVTISGIFCSCDVTVPILISYLILYGNSAVNPVVYAWKSLEFRKAFRTVLTCTVNWYFCQYSVS